MARTRTRFYDIAFETQEDGTVPQIGDKIYSGDCPGEHTESLLIGRTCNYNSATGIMTIELFESTSCKKIRSIGGIPISKNEARIRILETAIRDHRSQKADDRCIEDDDRLYAALGDGVKCDRRIGSKEEMLRNCSRFIDRRCEGGHWPTYGDLEKALVEIADTHEIDWHEAQEIANKALARDTE